MLTTIKSTREIYSIKEEKSARRLSKAKMDKNNIKKDKKKDKKDTEKGCQPIVKKGSRKCEKSLDKKNDKKDADKGRQSIGESSSRKCEKKLEKKNDKKNADKGGKLIVKKCSREREKTLCKKNDKKDADKGSEQIVEGSCRKNEKTVEKKKNKKDAASISISISERGRQIIEKISSRKTAKNKEKTNPDYDKIIKELGDESRVPVFLVDLSNKLVETVFKAYGKSARKSKASQAGRGKTGAKFEKGGKCPHCGTELPSRQGLKVHVAMVHSRGSSLEFCWGCNKAYHTLQDLKDHTTARHK